MAALGLA